MKKKNMKKFSKKLFYYIYIIYNIVMNSGIPLYEAIKNNDIELVKLLLIQGVDINIRDNYGETPLFKAAQNGKTEIVKLLLDKGAIS